MNDNLLIYLIQAQNYDALSLLVEKYKKFFSIWIKEIINKLNYSKEFDEQILINDLWLTLYKTIETYEPTKGIFYSYLKGAVHNVILNFLRSNHRIKAYSISLNLEIDENIDLIDMLSTSDNLSKIEERYNLIEEVENTINKINKFKEEEKKIIYLKIQGYGNDEIVEMLRINIRKVNYAVRKAKKL